MCVHKKNKIILRAAARVLGTGRESENSLTRTEIQFSQYSSTGLHKNVVSVMWFNNNLWKGAKFLMLVMMTIMKNIQCRKASFYGCMEE